MRIDLQANVLRLSHALGAPARDWAVVAEGNISARASSDTMLVKASGASMATARGADYVEVRLQPIIDLLDQADADDWSVTEALMGSRVDSSAKRPSVESVMHAVCLTATPATFVGHTHPTAVNSLLCSDRASELVGNAVFPDQIVTLGRHQLLIPYTDPGLDLGRLVRRELLEFQRDHDESPKVIYLESHGMFALGESAEDVLRITEMATKTARILLGALSVGSVARLTSLQSARIDTRPDEELRRRALSSDGDQW